MGASQYHPLLQKKQIEDYYVKFYMMINIGALLGGIIIPILCQHNIFVAYLLPVIGLTLSTVIFLVGARRYVRIKPQGSVILQSMAAVGHSFKKCPPSLENVKKSKGGKYEDLFVEKTKIMGSLFVLMFLVVPFNIAYGQMSTVFVIQAGVMAKVGFVDASWMQNFDALSVLLFGYLIGSHLYPYLESRGITLHIMTKLSIGATLGVLALLSDVIIEYQIHSAYQRDGSQLNIMWQIFPFVFIGAGEIFSISSSYEAAFLIAPEGMKTFGSAINLFFIGAIPTLISTALLNACQGWAFTSADGDTKLKYINEYATAHVYRYLWILVAIGILGIIAPQIPAVRRFYDRTLERSENLLKTPQ